MAERALCDKVAIVTGASSGIGAATAPLLAAEGCAVGLVARRSERLDALVDDIVSAGGRAIALRTDVTDRRQVESATDEVVKTFGRVDILVNNAGIMPLSPIRRLCVEDWERMIDVNVKGLLYCVAAVIPTMLAQRSGHILNVGSVAGRRPFYSGTVYSATKFAVRAISQGLRLELSPNDNIRVTDIEPGVVDTELTDHITDEETVAGFAQRWGDKRKLASADIARAILYAVTQPEHVNINELLVRPTEQEQ
ncbi:MAG: SDR family oxidoreductase [Gemmatimonadales bacterium]